MSHLPKVPLQIDIVKEECEGEVEDEEFIANEATSLLRSSYGSYTGDVSLIRPRIANTSPNRNPLTVSNSYNSRYSQNHLQSSPAKLKVNKGIPHFDWTTNRYDTASECGNSVDDDGSSIHSRSSSFNISSSSNVNGKSFSFNVAASNINTVVGPHSPTYGLSSSEINSNTNQNIGAFNTNNSNYRSGDDNDGDNFDDDYDYEVDPCSLDRYSSIHFC